MRTLFIAFALTAAVSAQTSDDRYPFVRDGKLGFIDYAGREVIPAQFQPIGDFAHFSEGLAPVDGPDGSGYIDPSGKFVIGPQRIWGQPRPFYKGVAAVLIWATNRSSLNIPALIDRSGRVIRSGPEVREHFFPALKPQPGWTGGFSEGLSPVQVRDLWAFVDGSGTVIIPPQFIAADHFWHGLARVAWKDGRGYIDTKGRTVWKLVTASKR